MNHNNLPGKCQVICYCDPYYAVVFGGCQDKDCYNSLNDCYSNMAFLCQYVNSRIISKKLKLIEKC